MAQLFTTKGHSNYLEALFYSSALVKFKNPTLLSSLGTVLTSCCCACEELQLPLLVSLNSSHLCNSPFIKLS